MHSINVLSILPFLHNSHFYTSILTIARYPRLIYQNVAISNHIIHLFQLPLYLHGISMLLNTDYTKEIVQRNCFLEEKGEREKERLKHVTY